jgi:radical SAM protein with 4Fe4S-binding SPASM domain
LEHQTLGCSHERVLKNVNDFYNHPSRIKSETQLVIQAVRTSLNKDEDIEGEAKKRWPTAEVSVRNMVADRVNSDLSALTHTTRDYTERQECLQASARLIIHSDGKIAPCCPAFKGDLIIGDANKDSIHTIFNSLIAKQLRLELKNGEAFKKEPCKNCSSYETFKGFKPSWSS